MEPAPAATQHCSTNTSREAPPLPRKTTLSVVLRLPTCRPLLPRFEAEKRTLRPDEGGEALNQTEKDRPSALPTESLAPAAASATPCEPSSWKAPILALKSDAEEAVCVLPFNSGMS